MVGNMKSKYSEWDQEKKLHRVEKGTNKAGKHRKNIYNMLSDYEDEDLESDGEDSEELYDLDRTIQR